MINGLVVNQVYLATGFTDMRKSINGLSLIVSEQFRQDPFDGSVFVVSAQFSTSFPEIKINARLLPIKLDRGISNGST